MNKAAPKKKEVITEEKPLWLTGTGYTVVVSKDAETLKKKLIAAAKVVVGVSSTEVAELAKGHRDAINRVLIDVEKVRKQIKQPVLDKGKEIDRTAEYFTQDLNAEKFRLDKLIGDFALAQEKIRREAAERAAAQTAEAARLQREQEEAEARAERLRLGAEQAAAEAESRKERMAAEAAAKQAEAEAAKAMDLSYAAGAAGMAAHQSSLVVMDTAKVRGTSVAYDYEVTDLRLLYMSLPYLVELTPKRREILTLLSQQREKGLIPALPGLKIKEIPRIR